jgi:hypothetical protein
MKKLLKTYELNSDMQYYEMIIDSVINGQRTQAKEQFKAMPKDNKKMFINANLSNWNSGLSEQDLAMFIAII